VTVIGISNWCDLVAPVQFAPSRVVQGPAAKAATQMKGHWRSLSRASTMAQQPLGDFNIPSPDMPSSDGEQPSSAQKPPPEEPYDGTGQLPIRDKRRGIRRASTDEDGGSSSSESEQRFSDEENGDESDRENGEIKNSKCASSSKDLVPDSDGSYSSDSDFLEDAPKKKQRLPRITHESEQIEQSGGKVSTRRARRSWSELGQFDISETSQTEIRNAFLQSAVSDFLTGGTPEPTGFTCIYISVLLNYMIKLSSNIFVTSDVCHNIQAPGGDYARFNLGPWTQSTVHRSRKGLVNNTTYKCFMYWRSKCNRQCALSLVAIP